MVLPQTEPLAPPLGLYLHFPWCVAKCPYCDFNSHSLQGDLPAATYVDALLAELRRQPRALAERPVVSVFLGGGTPSLFPPAEIARLLDGVRAHLRLDAAAEVTLEANPGAIEHGAFAGYRAAGVNRLSLGVQSFSDAILTRLGRVHDGAAAVAAYREARAAGFDNINLDLMYALPGQSLALASADAETAIALGPEHISHYHLTLEPNTVFFSRPPTGLPDDDAAVDIQQRCAKLFAAAGYRNYEVSAWSRTGRECRHNLNYWTFGDYLGIGAGAHGKLSAGDSVQRTVSVAHPREFMRRATEGTATATHTVAAADLRFEFMLNVLRLRDGVALASFASRTGLDPADLLPQLMQASELGLLDDPGDGRIRASRHGWRFLDDLQAFFLPPAETGRAAPPRGDITPAS